jgi:hypothetical protein
MICTFPSVPASRFDRIHVKMYESLSIDGHKERNVIPEQVEAEMLLNRYMIS